MEPMTLAIAALIAVASGITSGATGKIGEGVITAAQRWLNQIVQHSPETGKRLAAASDPNVIDVQILKEVKQAATEQPNIKAAMEKTVAAAAADGGSFPNLTKLAEKINSVNFGTITTQYNIGTQNNVETQYNIGTQNNY